jgi:uncharacterized protein YutE (UPF0331/DUF86 family)
MLQDINEIISILTSSRETLDKLTCAGMQNHMYLLGVDRALSTCVERLTSVGAELQAQSSEPMQDQTAE